MRGGGHCGVGVSKNLHTSTEDEPHLPVRVHTHRRVRSLATDKYCNKLGEQKRGEAGGALLGNPKAA